jgi:uncharacterized protein YciI
MRNIAANFGVKSYRTGPDEWLLVHDGRQVLTFAGPHTDTDTPAANTMLVGTQAEIQAEAARVQATAPPEEPTP